MSKSLVLRFSLAMLLQEAGAQRVVRGLCHNADDPQDAGACQQRCQSEAMNGNCVRIRPALRIALCVCSSTTTTTTTTVTPYSCDEGWTLYRQSCYFLSNTYGSGTSAFFSCADSGENVVSISDADENRFVNQFVLQKRDANDCADSGIPSDCQIYIGLRRCAQFCSEFSWSDETTPFGPGSYANWADSEPNMPSGQLACVEMLENGEWNDLPCDNQRFFVCERPANAAPAAPQSN